MRLLDGKELAGFIQERQARQVRALRQSEKIFPKLAIVQTTDNPVIDTYVRMKQAYGADILIDVEQHKVSSDILIETIDALNKDSSIHGIIVQLPLADFAQTEEAVNRVVPKKDVDGLGAAAEFDPATPMAIDWLVNGYNVDLKTKKIAIVGRGRLVGAPLAKMWQDAGYNVTVFDKTAPVRPEKLRKFPIIVSAAGAPGLITDACVAQGAVVVDAATASEDGKIVGDVADEVRMRSDLTITPEKGGVGPLTVCALFDNVIRAARREAEAQKKSES